MPPVPYRQRFLPKLTRTVNSLEGAVCTRIFTAVCRYGTARSPRQAEVARILIEHGADTKTVNKDGGISGFASGTSGSLLQVC